MIIDGLEYRVEIEITTDCNLKCLNCNRSCRQAPSKEQMSLEQIRKFIKESKKLGIEWKRGVRLLGGEPTLHNNLIEIILELYKNKIPMNIITNGISIPKSVKIFRHLENVKITDSKKEGIYNKFYRFNDAPIDNKNFKDEYTRNYCNIIYECGIGLSRYGFYVCGLAASIDRIFGFDIGLKSLKDVNLDSLNKQRDILCRYCGALRYPGFKDDRITDIEVISDTWKKAYKKHKESPPTLELY